MTRLAIAALILALPLSACASRRCCQPEALTDAPTTGPFAAQELARQSVLPGTIRAIRDEQHRFGPVGGEPSVVFSGGRRIGPDPEKDIRWGPVPRGERPSYSGGRRIGPDSESDSGGLRPPAR